MFILEELYDTPMREILAQGDRDGACFLYSIANAVGALACESVDQDEWLDGIRALPFDMRDYLAGSGTEKLDSNQHYLEDFCQNFLIGLGVNAKITWHEGIKSASELKNILSPFNVFIMAVDDDAHWVAIVDTDDKNTVFIACSAEALNGTYPYNEEISSRYGRAYNKQATFTELRAGKGYGLLISVDHKRKSRS